MRTKLVSASRAASSLAFAVLLICVLSNAFPTHAQKRRARPATASTTNSSSRSINVRTEPQAIVWLDEVRRGASDQSGKLDITKVSPGRHALRVRAVGFSERTLPVLATQRGIITIKLTRTTDAAELAFQEAETLREKARDDESKQAAKAAYERALRFRAAYPAAHVGLARVMLELNDYNSALAEIAAARRARPVYPEASAVEGRILREDADPAGAITAFRRSIREARGLQPEAHTGLARVLEDQGQYAEATTEFRTAINQLSDTEPALYQLLGAAHEKQQNYKEAVAAYEKYLQLAPEGNYASAIRSFIDQLKKQAAEQQTPQD